MPRVHHVQKAAKDHPEIGVKKGEPYYHWTFKNQRGPGTQVKSKTYPKPSQLTRSAFKSQWRGFSETIAEMPLDDGLYDALQELAGEIRALGEECQSSLDNMPEGLQQGSTGELLQTRIDNCESWASEIEGLDDPGQFDESEIEDLPTFESWLDDGGPAEPMPERMNYGGDAGDAEAWGEFLDALNDWAHEQWAAFGEDLAAKIEEARSEYDSKLEELRDEAANADPGEE